MTDLLSVTLFKDLEQLEHYPLLLHCAKKGTSAEGERRVEGERGGDRERKRGKEEEKERERERGGSLINTICYTQSKRLHVSIANKE